MSCLLSREHYSFVSISTEGGLNLRHFGLMQMDRYTSPTTGLGALALS